MLGPFVDITDGATPETGLTVAQANVRLSKNGGSFAQKNEATSATHNENGFYSIPFNATDTNTLGTLEVAVSMTGVALPVWMDFMILPANTYNTMVNGVPSTVTVSGTVVASSVTNPVTASAVQGGYVTVSGTVSANAVQINGNATAAANLKLQYDGTGLVGETYPATQGQVGNLTLAGAPAYEAPTSYVLSTGSVSAGTYANVDTSNGTYHTHTDSGGLLDLYYQYTLAEDEIAVEVVFKGRINGTNDSVYVQAYDWTTSAFVNLFTLIGTASTTDTSQSSPLVGKYTGTGVNIGKVRVRIVNAVSLTSATLYVDQLIIGKTITSRNVGYQDGAVWIDTVNGSTGTVAWINGTADNPVKSLADAYTIASSVGLNAFHLAAGSTITLTQSAANSHFVGAATINLNGQSVADALFEGAYTIQGASTGDDAQFIDCGIGSGTFYHGYFMDCRFKSVVTFISGEDYIIIRGSDTAVGAGNACTFIFAANVDAVFRDWRGGIQLNSMGATNTAIIDGAGRVVIDASSTGGSLTVRGHFPEPTGVAAFVAAGGTLVDNARWAEDQTVSGITNGYVTVTGTVSVSSVASVTNPVTVTGYVYVTGTANANVTQWLGVTPSVLQTGRVDSYVGKMAVDVLDEDALKLDAAQQIADVVWNEAQTDHLTAGSFGSYLDAKVSEVSVGTGSSGVTDWTANERTQIRYRLGIDGATGAPSATPTLPVTVTGYVQVTGTVVSSVVQGGYVTTSGTTSDPWLTTLPGAYGAGTAGKIVGDNLNATVGSRAVAGDAMTLTNAAVTAVTDDIFVDAVEGTVTFRQWVRRVSAVLFGKASGGGAAGSKKFRDLGDTVDRVDATTDANGNRTGVNFNDS